MNLRHLQSTSPQSLRPPLLPLSPSYRRRQALLCRFRPHAIFVFFRFPCYVLVVAFFGNISVCKVCPHRLCKSVIVLCRHKIYRYRLSYRQSGGCTLFLTVQHCRQCRFTGILCRYITAAVNLCDIVIRRFQVIFLSGKFYRINLAFIFASAVPPFRSTAPSSQLNFIATLVLSLCRTCNNSANHRISDRIVTLLKIVGIFTEFLS